MKVQSCSGLALYNEQSTLPKREEISIHNYSRRILVKFRTIFQEVILEISVSSLHLVFISLFVMAHLGFAPIFICFNGTFT